MRILQIKQILSFGLLITSTIAAQADLGQLQKDVGALKDQAAQKLETGDHSGSAFLAGTWTFTKRVCVSALTPEAISNPDEIKDISNIYTVFTYSKDGARVGNIINADGENNRCITQTEGAYASAPADIDLNGLKITEVVVNRTDVKKKLNCSAAYKGPKVADVAMVVKIDNDSFYFLLVPGLLAGTPASCKNPNDYNLDLAVRIPTL